MTEKECMDYIAKCDEAIVGVNNMKNAYDSDILPAIETPDESSGSSINNNLISAMDSFNGRSRNGSDVLNASIRISMESITKKISNFSGVLGNKKRELEDKLEEKQLMLTKLKRANRKPLSSKDSDVEDNNTMEDRLLDSAEMIMDYKNRVRNQKNRFFGKN